MGKLKAVRKLFTAGRRFLGNIVQGSMPSRFANFGYNKNLWNRYSRNWSKDIEIEDTAVSESDRESYVKYLGDEWGASADVEKVVSEYIYPHITQESVVAEIGTGGARIASKVAPKTREFHCMDISSEMLKRAKSVLAGFTNVRYTLLHEPCLPDKFSGRFDFVYSFDVFVHLDLHTMGSYFKGINMMLKHGGRAFVHTTNLNAPGGWDRFCNQSAYSIEGHYFISPETVDILARRSNLRIIKTSTVDQSNFYFNRDYLVVLEK